MTFRYGLKRGIPIALGYLSVSFGFGITAVRGGLLPWEAILISMTNLTSAGQLAGVQIMLAAGSFFEMILAQLMINLRYALMGISLTQRLARPFSVGKRLFLASGITDEIFAFSIAEKEPITPRYLLGLMTLPYIGWAAGTALGAFAGDILPAAIADALNLALYSMFIAIVVPVAKKEKGVLLTALIAVLLSCLFYYVPLFSAVSSGFSIILCALVAAGLMAFFCPLPEKDSSK